MLNPLKAKKLMGVILQEGSLFSHLTVQEHPYFFVFGCLKGLTRGVAQAQVEGLIPLLALEEYRGKKIKILSGGHCEGFSSRLLY